MSRTQESRKVVEVPDVLQPPSGDMGNLQQAQQQSADALSHHAQTSRPCQTW